ncbi:MAG: DNA polymerase III subunit alpha [Coriobacteriia bacterium]|nr:DNA polymerase III subunit alpha [Coriobacteriia bacterium]
MGFVHLHNHTEYSLLDGATKVADMAKQAKAFGMPAVAITDHGYMYGVPTFVEACEKEGVKPIVGCEVYFTPDRELRRDRKPELYHLILLAKNLTGYHNLIKICSKSATEAFYYKPRVTIDMLKEHAEGLIGTSACMAGIVAQSFISGDTDAARSWALELSGLFEPGDFYLEVQDQGIIIDPRERKKSIDLQDTHDANVLSNETITQNELNHRLNTLAKELGLKTVATNDMHYLRREDAYTQDIMLCIGTNSRFDDAERMRFRNDQFYMKSEEEMRTALKDFQDACDNTLEIAEKCNVELPTDYILPVVPLPDGETNESMLYKEALAGLSKKYGDPIPAQALERLEYEYGIICQQGFPAYFLVVQEFVRWAKENGVGVGPGRGSAAGSIVSYALDITTLDPLENGLLFERFLSLERPEMPDIDVDFDEDGRFKVIEHLRELYGPEKVAHVITYGSMKAKQAIVDAARVFDYPLYVGQNISKKIPFGPDTELKAVLGIHEDETLNKKQANIDLITEYKENPDTKKIIDAALALEGIVRGEGVHASAVIICRDPVEEHVPVKLDTKGGFNITQYDHKRNANLGLLKMDFLGLRTLNVLMKAKEYVKQNHGVDIDVDAIPLDDPKVFELLQRGETAGVFQVESPGMTQLIRSMNVNRYSDVVAAIALFRPGPLNSGMSTDYVERKTGKRRVVYYDNRLSNILEETFGTVVYQEQVMRISMEMSGFTAGESDVVRSAVAKKKIKLMKEDVRTWADGATETMQDHWLNGAERNGYSRRVAQTIWDDVEKFAEYAFNKSHSAAYAILVMQTAWIKAHYRIEFMAAVLSSFVGKADKLTHYIASCKQWAIDVLPPDVNSSGREFTPLKDSIRFGLAGIRGVGEAAADVIIAEREKGGTFTSLHDFVFRVPNTSCNKRAVDALVKAGAFDSTGYTRRQMMRFVEQDNLMETAAKRWRDKADGQVSLFEMFADAGVDSGFEEQIPPADGVEWDRRTRLGFEKEILKMYVSDHPMSPFADALAKERSFSIGELLPSSDDDDVDGLGEGEGAAAETIREVPQKDSIVLAGMISGVTPMVSKKGDSMAKFMLEDIEGSIEAIVFPKPFARYAKLIVDDAIVKVTCRYERSDRGVQVLVSEIAALDIDPERPRHQPLELFVSANALNKQVSDELMSLLQRYPGPDPAILTLQQNGGKKLRADLPHTVDSEAAELRHRLVDLLGASALK